MKRWLLWLLVIRAACAAEPFDLVFVGAHPDDDSVATATLRRYVKQGKRVAVITATRGEQGANMLGPEQGAELGKFREQEQRQALGLLGIHRVDYLNCQDSGFTTSLQVSERNWGRSPLLAELLRLFDELQPAVVITMNPGPRGHGDHQLIAQLASEAFVLSAHGRKLYYALEYGAEGLKPSLTVPLADLADEERRALACYRSQGWHEGHMPLQADESFWLAARRIASDVPEEDMLAGLDGAIVPDRHARPLPAPAVELERSPALQSFLNWSRSWGLALDSLAPPTRVVEVGEEVKWPFLYNPPQPDQPPWLSAVAANQPGPQQLESGTLQVVPSITLLGSNWSEWQEVHQSWEGSHGGPADLQGRFRLRRLEGALEVEAQVRDDDLVANLSARENRAHWRSDALEITIDPCGSSQDTTTTFKLGVVISNLEGECMAARDADAQPGPWELPIERKVTEAGYELRARIPENALPGILGATFGFNLMLYDVDTGQSPSRLAWSAWETVQGRPELWGRVHSRL